MSGPNKVAVAKPADAAKPQPKGRDKYGFPDVRKGYVRGRAENLRRSTEVSDFGEVLVIEFDLKYDPDGPGIPVRLEATDFAGRIIEGSFLDVPDPDPRQRPIRPFRVQYVTHNGDGPEVVAHFPGRFAPSRKRGMLWSMLFFAAPFVVVLSIVAALVYVFNVIH